MPHKDPNARRAYMRAYKKNNPEKFGRDYDRVRHANRRAALYGASGELTIDDVRAVKRVGRCHYCGATESTGAFKELGIDHVIPLHAGGANGRSNLVCCCHSCNASKFRGAAPGQWSRTAECCVDCGTIDRKHCARGRCERCYKRAFQSAASRGGIVGIR